MGEAGEALGSASSGPCLDRLRFLEGRCTCIATSPVFQCSDGTAVGEVGSTTDSCTAPSSSTMAEDEEDTAGSSGERGVSR